ncbi:MAG: DNA alkylation repair protein [Alistipes sp.]|nr:DNA alkylation repair protein [Alistipes senegalensis]MCM1251072.1 DNA alkylation repair protein [Alistipes sp.]
METTLREQLFGMADLRYRDFSASLTPGAGKMIGVRLPLLRNIAREIARGDWRAWLEEAEDEYFEERMLQGLVIGYAKCPPDEKLRLTARFIPKIDNWAICDCFCWRLRSAEREPMRRFIQPYFDAPGEYEVRFAVVMALSNFVDEEHVDRLLERLGTVRHEGYYVRMGVAWAVSVCYVKFPERTLRWLGTSCPLADRTYNKALQKIVESLRVSDAEKATIRSMKRRPK